MRGPILLVRDFFLISAPSLDSRGWYHPYLLIFIFLPQHLPSPTKRESVTLIKQSVISKVPLRNNEASNAVGAVDGGLVKLMWFPTPPLSEEVGVEKLLTQHS